MQLQRKYRLGTFFTWMGGCKFCYIFPYLVVLHVLNFFPFGIFSDKSASHVLPADKSKFKPQVVKGKGDKGKGKAQNENPPPGAPYSFTEAQEEAIARWMESKKLLYDMKDRKYKDRALRRQL